MKTSFRGIQNHIDQWIAFPGITPQEFSLRKLILSGLSFNFLGSLLLATLAWTWGLERTGILTATMVMLIALSFLGVYLRWGSLQNMYFIIEIWSILFAFLAIIALGGIPYSGGFILLEITVVMTSMLLQDFRRIQVLFLLFLVTVILGGILPPSLHIEPELSPIQNFTYFVMMAIGFSAFMFQFNRTFWRQRLVMEHERIKQLEEIDKVKTRLFTNISHEFRTPLTVILGMAQLIRENPEKRNEEGIYLIERNGRRLLRLVNQMMNLSKLQSGAMPVHYAQADAIPALRYILESFHSTAENKGIQLHFHSNTEALLMDLDTEKLEQIIGNLLTNALKYTSRGGLISLQTQVVEAGQSPLSAVPGLEKCLLIRVEDTGTGIAPEHLARIFDRFYQADAAAAQSGEGSGIGLAITREYIQLLNGHISVESTPGKGTIFTIYLPVRRQAPFPETAPVTGRETLPSIQMLDAKSDPASGEDSDNPLLLIIEDNRDVIRYLETILLGKYRLRVARDGQEGIEKALALVPDIVISDVMMPRKDGFEVCRTLKTDFRTNHIPIILLTARADMASRISGLQLGADAYLAKPFNREELTTELSRLIRLRAVLKQKYGGLSFEAAKPKPAGLNERFLYDVNHILERNYQDENFGIPELCVLMTISRTQLHRKLVALTGRSASHVIRAFRLQKAVILLQNSRKTIAEVAYAVGFKDPYYFSRVFTEAFGEPPVAVRQPDRHPAEQ